MASTLDTSVKNYRNSYAGIPQLAMVRGDLVKVLDAILVNGFGQRTIDGASYSDGVITYSISANPFPEWVVVLVAGASDPELNGEFRVWKSSSGSIQLPVTGVVAAPVSTAGMTIKFAPMGYEIYRTNGVGKRVYRSTNPASNKNCLVVHDEAMPGYTKVALWAAVGIVADTDSVEPEDFTGIQAPVLDTMPYLNWKPGVEPGRFGWYRWYYKKQGNDSSAVAQATLQYSAYGDDMLFYLENAYSGVYGRARYTFGEFETYSPGDVSNTLLVAEEATGGEANATYPGSHMTGADVVGGMAAASAQGRLVLGAHDNIQYSKRWWMSWAFVGTDYAPVSGVSGLLPWPNTATGETLFFEISIICDEGLRGRLPGLYALPHSRALFSDFQIMRTLVAQGEDRRRFMITKTQRSSTNDGQAAAVDLTGPWRAR